VASASEIGWPFTGGKPTDAKAKRGPKVDPITGRRVATKWRSKTKRPPVQSHDDQNPRCRCADCIAATRIQAHTRAWLARRQVKRLRREHAAALRIQSGARGWTSRWAMH
jgi:hypothetical protein